MSARVDFNPRYVIYARSKGHTPDEQLAIDAGEWVGGKMAGFTLWMASKWAAWDYIHGYTRDHIRDSTEHEAFDVWLGIQP